MEELKLEMQHMRRQLLYIKWYAMIISLILFSCIAFAFRKSANDDIAKLIRAEKIEIVESDGTVKLSLFNKKNQPAAMVDGFKLPREGGGESGLMYYNEEGEECGGFTYAGAAGKGNTASLSMDNYKQDQVVQLVNSQGQGNNNDVKGLSIFDRPDVSIVHSFQLLDSIRKNIKDPVEQQKAIDKLVKQGYFGYKRLFAGQYRQSTGLFVHDSLGRKRLELVVNAQNQPQIVFYNEKEQVIKKLIY